MGQEIMNEDGIQVCPDCGSKRITLVLQAALLKMSDANTGRTINPYTGERRMSNRDKAKAYDAATGDGVGCWFYICRRCGWKSEMLTERIVF